MPGRGRPAELLDEAVVAAAAEDRRLRVAQRRALELEEGVRVVVEAPHERSRRPRSRCRATAARPAPARRGRPTRRRGGRPSAAHRRAPRGSASRFESRTRSGWRLDLGRVVRRQVVGAAAQPRLQHLGVGGPVGRRAHEVHHQPPLAAARARQVGVPERDDLDVDVGVGASRCTRRPTWWCWRSRPACGLLVPERGRGVPDLPRHRRPVLHVGPGDRRRALRAQRDVAAALVLEVVHLLGDDVGALADALEHADVLEHRRLDQPVPEAPREPGERGQQRLPAGRLRGQHVLRALGGTEVRTLGHGGRGYRSPATAPKSIVNRGRG